MRQDARYRMMQGPSFSVSRYRILMIVYSSSSCTSYTLIPHFLQEFLLAAEKCGTTNLDLSMT